MPSTGKVFVVGSGEQVRQLIPIARAQGSLVVWIRLLDDLKKAKAKRIDVLPGALLNPKVAEYCKQRKIQVFRWTTHQWFKLADASEGGD